MSESESNKMIEAQSKSIKQALDKFSHDKFNDFDLHRWRTWMDTHDLCDSFGKKSESDSDGNNIFSQLQCQCPYGSMGKGYLDVTYANLEVIESSPCNSVYTEEGCMEMSKKLFASDHAEGSGYKGGYERSCEWKPILIGKGKGGFLGLGSESPPELHSDLRHYGICTFNKPLHPIYNLITFSCVFYSWLPLFFILFLIFKFFFFSKRSTSTLFNLMFIIISMGLNELIIKKLIVEQRPAESCSGHYGMPSSHSLLAVGYLFLAMLQIYQKVNVSVVGVAETGKTLYNSKSNRNIKSLSNGGQTKNKNKNQTELKNQTAIVTVIKEAQTDESEYDDRIQEEEEQKPIVVAGKKIVDSTLSDPSSDSEADEDLDDMDNVTSKTPLKASKTQTDNESKVNSTTKLTTTKSTSKNVAVTSKSNNNTHSMNLKTSSESPSDSSVPCFSFSGIFLDLHSIFSSHNFIDSSELSLSEGRIWLVLFLSFSIPIPISRVVLRDHTASQVLIGGLVGVVLAVLYFKIMRIIMRRCRGKLGESRIKFFTIHHDMCLPFGEFKRELVFCTIPALSSLSTCENKFEDKKNLSLSSESELDPRYIEARNALNFYLEQRLARLESLRNHRNATKSTISNNITSKSRARQCAVAIWKTKVQEVRSCIVELEMACGRTSQNNSSNLNFNQSNFKGPGLTLRDSDIV